MCLGTYFETIRSIFPDSSINMKLVGFINDTYKVDSIKNMSRQNREISSSKFKITDFEQNMPQGNNWQKLLNDSEYKDQSIEMIKQYILEFVSGILPRTTPFIIISTGNEYYVSPAENQVISGCNHEDSGARLVLHGSKVNTDVVVVVYKDTSCLYFNDMGIFKVEHNK